MKVSEMLPIDQPQRRLVDLGPQALSTPELLALVLGLTDLRDAHELLRQTSGSLRLLAQRSLADFCATRGVGKVKAVQLAAAFELGRRMSAEVRGDSTTFLTPNDVVAHFAPALEDLAVEEFHIAILNSQHRMERAVRITRGILQTTLVHPREVFREAIAEQAAAVILVHNHPSGDPTPTADDRSVTDQLVAAGRLLDLPVRDHVIIGRGRYHSFAEAGQL